MQLAVTPYDSLNNIRVGTQQTKPAKASSSSRNTKKMPFFSLNRSPSSGKPPKEIRATSTVSESYPDTDELTLDGMTLSGMTFGNDTVSTANLDSVIRRSVNLGGDHLEDEVISVRKTPTSSRTHESPLITDDIDERIQAYRHAVSSYREQQHHEQVSPPQGKSHYQKFLNQSKPLAASKSSSSGRFVVDTDDYFHDEFTLPGLSVGGGDSTHHEPRARAVFRPVVDKSKRSKAAAATIEPTISSRRRGMDVQHKLNSARQTTSHSSSNKISAMETPKQTSSAPSRPTYIAPRIEKSRTNDSSEKENGSNHRYHGGIHKTRSMSSFESGRTSSTTTTRDRKNPPPKLVELPPSSVSMKIMSTASSSSTNNNTSKARRPSVNKYKQDPTSSMNSSKKQIQSTGLPNPYANFPDDEGLYDDPPLLPLDDSMSSSGASPDKKDASVTDDSNTSFSLDLDVMVNQSDKDLMEKQGVSGALLLTTEGLKEHDRLMSSTFSPKAMDSASLNGAMYNTWSKSIEEAKKSVLSRPKSNNGAMPASNGESPLTPSPVKVKTSGPSPATTKSLTPVSQSSLSNKGAMSSVPVKSLNTKPEKKKRRGLLGFLFGGGSKAKQPTSSPFAQDLLEQERQDEELMRQHELNEKKELERIENKRKAYLEMARQKEAAAFQLPDKMGGTSVGGGESSVPSPPLAVIEENDDDCSLPFDVKGPTSRVEGGPLLLPSRSMGSGASVSSSALPPCSVCRSGDRTHIATPCMHFAFCGKCADNLQAKGICPVCSRSNVTFAQVSV